MAAALKHQALLAPTRQRPNSLAAAASPAEGISVPNTPPARCDVLADDGAVGVDEAPQAARPMTPRHATTDRRARLLEPAIRNVNMKLRRTAV
jgi:hypothetical protein